jgi:hypothetical protein
MKKPFHETLAESFDKKDWPMHEGKILISPEHLKESIVQLAKLAEYEEYPSRSRRSGCLWGIAAVVGSVTLVFCVVRALVWVAENIMR